MASGAPTNMNRPTAVFVQPIVTSSNSGRTLTYKNGFYTIKSASVSTLKNTSVSNAATTNSPATIIPKISFPTTMSPRCSATGGLRSLVTTRIVPRIVTPQVVNEAPKASKVLDPIPKSVMEIRNELYDVQKDLKFSITTHNMLQNKQKLYGKHMLATPGEIDQIKCQSKDIEEKISLLQSRQTNLILAIREGLVNSGMKMPKSLVKKSDIGHNANMYKPSKIYSLSSSALTSGNILPAAASKPSTSQSTGSVPSKPSTAQSTEPVTTRVEPVRHISVRIEKAVVHKEAEVVAPVSLTPDVDVDVVNDVECDVLPGDIKSDFLSSATNSTKRQTQASKLEKLLQDSSETALTTSSPSSSHPSTSPSSQPLVIKLEADDGDDIEVIKVVNATSLATKSQSKPHLLTKPVSMSPVPPITNERDAQYSSVQEGHLLAVRRVSNAQEADPEQQHCLDFMTSLDLVTPETLKNLQQRKSERRRITRSRSEAASSSQMKRANEFITTVPAKRPRRSTRASSPTSLPPLTAKPKTYKIPPLIGLADDDGSLHDDFCAVCSKSGELLLCDTCTQVFHLGCVNLKSVPVGKWSCIKCTAVRKAQFAPTSKSASAISAVKQFVQTKAVKDAERAKLLKINTDLVEETKSHTNNLKNMDKIVEGYMGRREDLNQENQKTRKMLQNLVSIVKALKRLPR